MATKCRKCGEAIAGTPKFCVTCGAPVPDIPPTLESKAFTPPAVRNVPTTEPPKTKASVVPEPPPARSSNYGPPPNASQPPPAPPQPQQAWPSQAPYGAPAPAYAPYPPPQAYAPPPGGQPPYPPQYAPPPFVAGGRVLVLWADGNRYPGIVQQVAPTQCLVVFPDGQQRWVEHTYLTPTR